MSKQDITKRAIKAIIRRLEHNNVDKREIVHTVATIQQAWVHDPEKFEMIERLKSDVTRVTKRKEGRPHI